MKRISGFLILLLAIGCSREQAVDNTKEAASRVAAATNSAAERIKDTFDTSVPVGNESTSEELERERFNADWRKVQSFQQKQRQDAAARAQQTAAAVKAQQAAAQASTAAESRISFVQTPKFVETLKAMVPTTLDTLPVSVPITGDVSGPSVLRAQIMLDRARFSVGPIDGRWGKNSEIAVYWFQRENGIEPTGAVDEPTYRALITRAGMLPTLRSYTITPEDMKGPFTPIPEDMYEKAKLDCLCYETPHEMLAERFHTTKDFLSKLNPNVNFETLAAGATILAPNIREELPETAAKDIVNLVVSAKGWYIHGFDATGNVVFHAPTTLGSKYDPSPNEKTKIVGIAFNPTFHYQPKLFAEVPDEEPEANLRPGPNSPVGRVWMALSKPHFGIHGTAVPDSIGYSASHGCVRLTNWDAMEVARRVVKQAPVEFVDTRSEGAAGG